MATQTTVATRDIPEWAKPFYLGQEETADQPGIMGILPQAEALFQQGYTPYTGDRIAGLGNLRDLQRLQRTAISGAEEMRVAPGTTTAQGLAGSIAETAANYGYAPGTFRNQFVAPTSYQPTDFQSQYQAPTTLSAADTATLQSYMNPYQQAVTDIQKREAARQSDIMRTQQQAAATKAGAYGGSRQAIVEAERQRNLGQQLQDIQNVGDQQAYQLALAQLNAEQNARLAQAGTAAQYGQAAAQLGEQSRQYGAGQEMQAASTAAQYGQAAAQLGEQSAQYGAGLGLQGLQTGLQGAGQLGALSQQGFQQGMDINQLLAGYGSQAQALGQAQMDTAYQDFLRAQQYPYQQLGFYSDIVNAGMSGASNLGQSAQTMYQSPPSTLSQLAGVGTALYGLNTLAKAEGGKIKAPDNRKKPAGLADLALTKMA